MKVYVVTVYQTEEAESYILGVYTSQSKAGSAMESHMATVYGLNEFTDWDHDWAGGLYSYFYEVGTVEIQRVTLDETWQ